MALPLQSCSCHRCARSIPPCPNTACHDCLSLRICNIFPRRSLNFLWRNQTGCIWLWLLTIHYIIDQKLTKNLKYWGCMMPWGNTYLQSLTLYHHLHDKPDCNVTELSLWIFRFKLVCSRLQQIKWTFLNLQWLNSHNMHDL